MAMYAATDGRTPESVQVEWDDFGPSAHPSGEDIRDLIGLLFAAPDMRRSTYAEPTAADGFTLYPIGDRRVTMPAGSAAEDVPTGTAMTPDNARPEMMVWKKKETT